jgi:polysaccharide biosynthesis protein PslG
MPVPHPPNHTRRPKHAWQPKHACLSGSRSPKRLSTITLVALLGLLLPMALLVRGTALAEHRASTQPSSSPKKHKRTTTTSTALTTTSAVAATTTTTTTAPSATVATTTTAATTVTAATSGLEAGVNWHPLWGSYSDADNYAIVDKLAAAGVRWARIDIGWDNVFPDGRAPTGQWAIDKVDRAVNYASSRGIKILGIWYRTPGWANGNRGVNVPPSNNQDYADSARWAASHWAGRIQAWEVWNEPDPSQTFWLGTQDQYVALLKAGYPGFHAGDPNTLVVLGAPASNDDGWIAGIYSRGGKDSFDVLATHPYQGRADMYPEYPDDGHRWWFTHFPAVKAVMDRYGDGSKPVWFTEFGWSSHPNYGGEQSWQLGVTEQQQADYLVRAFKYAKANWPNVKVMFAYEARNETCCDTQNNNFGLLHRDLTAKPVYSALQAASSTFR